MNTDGYMTPGSGREDYFDPKEIQKMSEKKSFPEAKRIKTVGSIDGKKGHFISILLPGGGEPARHASRKKRQEEERIALQKKAGSRWWFLLAGISSGWIACLVFRLSNR